MQFSVRNQRTTGVGKCLSALLSCALLMLGATARAEELRITGTGSGLGVIQKLAAEFERAEPGARIIVLPSLGSGGGIKAALAGALDLAVTSRGPNEEERNRGAVGIPFARTPFVIAAGAKAATRGLSLDQVASFYRGDIATWPDGTPVRVVLRPESDTDTATLKGMSAHMAEAVATAARREGLKVAATDYDAASAIETIPGAVGPSTLALIVTERRTLRPLTLDGVTPSVQALQAGTYPHSKTLHLVLGPKSPPLARRFTLFASSSKARALLLDAGCVPVN